MNSGKSEKRAALKKAVRLDLVLISLAFLTTVSGSVLAADLLWTNGLGDGLWNAAGNWSPLTIPSFDFGDRVKINSLPGPLVTDGVEATCQWLILSDDASADLNMSGGIFSVFDFVTYSGDSGFIIANNASGSATFTLDAGLVMTDCNVYVGYKGQGTVRMKTGRFEIGGILGIGYCDTGIATGRGSVYLNGGTITAANLQIASPSGCTGLLDISGGTLIIDGDKRSLIYSYMTDGRIVAYGGTGEMAVDYGSINPGKTTVRWLGDPQKASNPNPGYNAVDVPPDVNLSWTAGVGATSHKVYFGTTSPGEFQDEQDSNSYNLPVLDYNTTYYWRVDEVIGANTVTGVVWKFTTTDGVAKNPDPINNWVTTVPSDKVLHWTAGHGAISHDIYFGTDAAAVEAAQHLSGDLDGNGQVDCNDLFILTSCWQADPAGSVPYAGVNDDDIVNFDDYALLAQNWMGESSPLYKGSVSAASYDPDIVPERNYYWRVDEVYGAKRVKGDVWSFSTFYSLIGKIMCGYQGWFTTPGDGLSTSNWKHWSDKSTFTQYNCKVDMWPDVTEMLSYATEATGFASGTNHYYVFSSYKRNIVLRHFQWMRDYGIDGIYLQRFANELSPGSSNFNLRNAVLDHCKEGANTYGRKYAVMYDLSNLSSAADISKVVNDWKYLLDTKRVTKDSADYGYMRHRGKPVVAVWGIGFGRAYEGQEVYNLVNFLKNDPVYGGNIVMIGVNDTWRLLPSPDPWVQNTYLLADIISPWSVGRYNYANELNGFATSVWQSDVIWCQENSTPSHLIEYLPVIWPGYSHHNAEPAKPYNEMPRRGGQFFWDQLRAAILTGHANMLYIAMFDEVDEGTAIFKISNNPPTPGGVSMFITPDYDGYPLPTDEYLWLAGQASRALRGEISIGTAARPAR
jgi:glycoprotein endo-alpha-1,2-mannosidase